MNPFINPLEEHNIYQQLKKKLQKSSNTDSSPSTEKPEEESSVLIPSRLQSLSDLLNNHETWTSVSFEEVVKAWCQLANLQSGFWLSGEGGSHRVFHTPFGLSYVVYCLHGKDRYPNGYVRGLRDFINDVIAAYKENIPQLKKK